MPASTVTLDDGTTSITINGPAGPTNYELLPRTVSERTANHERYSYQLTSKKVRLWSMRFTDLTQAQKDDLVSFYTDDVIGPTNTFTYTHTDDQAYSNVRFANNGLQITREEPGIYSADVTLELEDSIS